MPNSISLLPFTTWPIEIPTAQFDTAVERSATRYGRGPDTYICNALDCYYQADIVSINGLVQVTAILDRTLTTIAVPEIAPLPITAPLTRHDLQMPPQTFSSICAKYSLDVSPVASAALRFYDNLHAVSPRSRVAIVLARQKALWVSLYHKSSY